MTNSILTRFVALSALLFLWPVKGLAENQIPVADAGLSRYAAADPVQLDGTGSYDPDKSGPLSYTWRQISGPSVTITDANTATPTIWGPMQTDARGHTVPGPFVQTDAVQECEFELVVSDAELTSSPDTVKIFIVPDFGPITLQQQNPPFNPNKPTVFYFSGGDCVNGFTNEQPWGNAAWFEKANIINFPAGYVPDVSYTDYRTYYHMGDMIIVFLSKVAPDYQEPIQTIGWSTGGQPALDAAIRLNRVYKDARYTVNHVTELDAPCRWQLQGMNVYTSSNALFLTSAVDGEPCWHDHYWGDTYPMGANAPRDLLCVWLEGYNHAAVRDWYRDSLATDLANQFRHGIVAGAYWSVVGPGKNLQLTQQNIGHYFHWTREKGMTLSNELTYPGRLPESVTLLVWRYPWLPDDDPNSAVLTCAESENAVGYQFLSGSDPYNVAHYNIVADSNSRPAVTAAMLPSSDTWWTVRVRDAYGSTIYADPIRVDSRSALGAIPAELVDFNQDFKVDLEDFSELAQHWGQYEPSVDIIPAANGNGVVDVKDLAILLECWLKEAHLPVGLFAYWKLDETEGPAAHDRAGAHDGTLHSDPVWQPTSGKVRGALRFDGTDDYVSTPFILDPSAEAFSVFAWVKGGGAEQAIISQAGGVNWLAAGTSQGKLMTELKAAGRFGMPLFSETAIIDGEWHRVGLTWNGSTRTLFVDGIEVAKGTQDSLVGSDGGLYIGAGKNLEAGSFWSGLIDDVRIYDRAIKP